MHLEWAEDTLKNNAEQ